MTKHRNLIRKPFQKSLLAQFAEVYPPLAGGQVSLLGARRKDVGMHKAAAVLLLIVFSFLNSSCSPSITPEEAKVLVTLDEIQRGVESNIDLDRFEQLLNTASAEIQNLKQNSKNPPCFMSAVTKCYASYEIAGKAWKRMETEQDAKRKEDMEMTLAFSLSFSRLNIEKANKCYQ